MGDGVEGGEPRTLLGVADTMLAPSWMRKSRRKLSTHSGTTAHTAPVRLAASGVSATGYCVLPAPKVASPTACHRLERMVLEGVGELEGVLEAVLVREAVKLAVVLAVAVVEAVPLRVPVAVAVEDAVEVPLAVLDLVLEPLDVADEVPVLLEVPDFVPELVDVPVLVLEPVQLAVREPL